MNENCKPTPEQIESLARSARLTLFMQLCNVWAMSSSVTPKGWDWAMKERDRLMKEANERE